jgi:hypothetical protein
MNPQDHPQYLPTEATSYVWTEQQRDDLMTLRQHWLDCAKQLKRRSTKTHNPIRAVSRMATSAALEGTARDIMELIEDHLV